MRQAEHQLRMCFDDEYKARYAEYRERRKFIMGLGYNYFKNPITGGVLLLLPSVTSVMAWEVSPTYWWLGIPIGVLIVVSVPILSLLSLVKDIREEMGLERVWPW
jgi:hypothetical protein